MVINYGGFIIKYGFQNLAKANWILITGILQLKLEAIQLEAIHLETIQLEAIHLEAIHLETIQLEAVKLEAVKLEAVWLPHQLPLALASGLELPANYWL